MGLRERMMEKTKFGQDFNSISLKDRMENRELTSNPKEGLRLAETFVKKFYLDELDTYTTTKPSRSVLELSINRNLKLFKISGLVFDKDENIQDRLNNVYSSMHGLNLSVIFMLISDGRNLELYMGTKTLTEDFNSNRGLSRAFEKAFKGNFSGCELEEIKMTVCDKLLKEKIPENGENAITSLTSLPSLKDDEAMNTQYVQGLEKFIDTMQGEEYTVLIISDPISGGRIEQVKQGYEELYSELAPLAEYNLTVAANKGISLSKSEVEGYTETIGKSVSKTQSFTKGTSITKSESTTNTFGVGVGVMGNLGNMSSDSTNSKGNIIATLGSSIFGGPVAAAAVQGLSHAIGANVGVNASKSKQTGTSTGENESQQIGNQETSQSSQANMKQESQQRGITAGTSTSSMVKYENKSVKNFLECIEEHLKILKECENYGMWSSAAYFISPSKETSIISASAYKGIINGEGTSLESSSMNTWYKDENTKKINNYLRHFTHPRFHDPNYLVDYKAIPDVTPSTMISTKELSIQCSVPYKSVPGIFVREMAGFGRNVYDMKKSKDHDKYSKLRLGCIYHMGEDCNDYEVSFDLESLREHIFITGSTGSGKSNTVYELVSRLNSPKKDKDKISTLIIEPAKGEYKQIFGEKFNTYGTNPAITELLRINPFKFEKEIHILEHIDRLIDIFNVCWPMYAAMPAVLKAAVENAYIQCGWSLSTSTNKYGYDLFPCFTDLLESLRIIINDSDYSQEVKDNYTGSLITRVKSLTNGLNGQIFTANEIDSIKLFEESTIVDLSRIGSSETKSMIMGIIVMRLQEYRMSKGGINLPLKHVTVIEEAHNLLKRTSYEQSSESANLLGKSVEMISNAIAEMRTYGEGFVIVDQAPGLLDMSVIRNTNTKIIMHLPDMTDRELVGKSAGMSDDQLMELAKIPAGVASVYQNRWIEPVLCHVDYYEVKPQKYLRKSQSILKMQDEGEVKQHIVKYLIALRNNNDCLVDMEKFEEYLVKSNLKASLKISILSLIKSDKEISKIAIEKLVCDLVDSDNRIFQKVKCVTDISEWNKALIDNLEISTEDLSTNNILNILECLIHYRSLGKDVAEENFLKWMKYMGRKVV